MHPRPAHILQVLRDKQNSRGACTVHAYYSDTEIPRVLVKRELDFSFKKANSITVNEYQALNGVDKKPRGKITTPLSAKGVVLFAESMIRLNKPVP